MSKLTIALAAALALGAGSTAMAKSYRASAATGYGMQQHAGNTVKAGARAYGRAVEPDFSVYGGRPTDPDPRIRAQLQREPSPADF